jgi:peroxiredoxin
MVLLNAGCGDNVQPLLNGQPPPGFTLQALDGREVSFPQDFAGKTVVIRFWADWCPFCESEMRAIEPVYLKYREQGLHVLAVNVRQGPEQVRRFTEKLGISYQTLLDQDGRVARAYAVSALPVTFLVNPDGVLEGRILGESTAVVFEQLILQTMDGR